MTVGTSLECANCGEPIGKLETPHLVDEQVVCAACDVKLRRSMPIAAPVNAIESRAQIAARMLRSDAPAPGAAWRPPRPALDLGLRPRQSSAGKSMQMIGAASSLAGITLAAVGTQREGDVPRGIMVVGLVLLLGGLLIFGIGRFLDSQR